MRKLIVIIFFLFGSKSFGQAPIIPSSNVATGVSGSPFNYTITVQGNPKSFISDPLPVGLTLDSHTGVISGIPTSTGKFTLNIFSFDSSGQPNSQKLTITIIAFIDPSPTSVLDTLKGDLGLKWTHINDLLNGGNKYEIQNSGFLAKHKYLPHGLKFDKSTGEITGIPKTYGDFSVPLSPANTPTPGSPKDYRLPIHIYDYLPPPNSSVNYKAKVFTTNFTIPIIRFNRIDRNSVGAPKDRIGNVSFFNSIGAGVSYSWCDLTEQTDSNSNTISYDIYNKFSIELGFLFASNSDSTSKQNIFAPTIGIGILNFELGYGYELGTLGANQKRGFVTLAYAIPVSKLIKGGFYTVQKIPQNPFNTEGAEAKQAAIAKANSLKTAAAGDSIKVTISKTTADSLQKAQITSTADSANAELEKVKAALLKTAAVADTVNANKSIKMAKKNHTKKSLSLAETKLETARATIARIDEQQKSMDSTISAPSLNRSKLASALQMVNLDSLNAVKTKLQADQAAKAAEGIIAPAAPIKKDTYRFL